MSIGADSLALDFESPSRENGRAFYLTNRQNLLEILSSGMLGPLAAYPKYYKDLLEICPGRVPLIAGPASGELVDSVSEGPATFPVLVEIDRQALHGAVPALKGSGESTRLTLQDGAGLAWAPGGAIPLAAVRRIVFRSQNELEEHSARIYEGLRADRVPFSVDPSAFVGDSTGILGWLQALSPVLEPNQVAIDHIDRLSGARCFAISTAPTAEAGLAAAASLLGLKRGSLTPPKLAEWLSLTGVLDSGIPNKANLETRFFVASANTLRHCDPLSAWRPQMLLDEIESAVRARKLNKKEDQEITLHVDNMRAILRNERDFKPFRPGVGLAAAKGLLLVLLRRDPETVSESFSNDAGSDPEVVLTAAVLTGLLHGRVRLPLAFRPSPLDDFLSVQAAREMCAQKDCLRLPGQNGEVETTVSRGPGGQRVALASEGVELMAWITPRDNLLEELTELAAAASNRALALEVCRLLEWSECVRSELQVSAQDLRISVANPPKGLTISFRGWADSVSEDIDWERFGSRLQAGIPDQLLSRLRELIAKA